MVAKIDNMRAPGKEISFRTKLQQAVEMIIQVVQHFVGVDIIVACDSWFGNDGLFKPLRKQLGSLFHLLSRLRSNTVLYAMPQKGSTKTRGRRRKYGRRLGSCAEMAAEFIAHASTYRVFLYGKHREVNAFSQIVMLKTLKCPVRVVWVFRKTQWVALFSTDMDLSVEQIIEYYGARWKIDIFQPYCLHKCQVSAADVLFSHVNDRSTVWADPYIQVAA